MKMNRRTFLKDAAAFAAGLGLGPVWWPKLADALEELATGRAPVLWLQGQTCSGCSISLLNSEFPGPADLLTRYLALYFHPTLSAATGALACETVDKAIAAGNYILIVEGAVPLGMPKSCVIGGEPFAELVVRAARKAQAVAAVGACASFGGIPAAPPNLTGASSLADTLSARQVAVPLINLPGCPAHPDWIVGNLLYLLKVGVPALDEYQRPKHTYGRLLHDQCPNFAAYQEKRFAREPGEAGCQFKLGCQGVVSHSDCSTRQWNGGVNWCVKARSVCVGCSRPDFAQNPNYPFMRLDEMNG